MARGRLASLVTVLLLPATAYAEPHRHDDFYFRSSFGVGSLEVELESEFETIGTGDVDGGVSWASELMLGGTLPFGLALGGALLAVQAPDPRFTTSQGPQGSDVDATLLLVGPFVDWFIVPRKGFHLAAAVGWSAFVYKDLELDDRSTREGYAGWGGAVWAGYDHFISANWSLGGHLRFMAFTGQRQVDYSGTPLVDETATGTSIGALFSALYH